MKMDAFYNRTKMDGMLTKFSILLLRRVFLNFQTVQKSAKFAFEGKEWDGLWCLLLWSARSAE